jgi:hypothetical protein
MPCRAMLWHATRCEEALPVGAGVSWGRLDRPVSRRAADVVRLGTMRLVLQTGGACRVLAWGWAIC